MFKATQITKYLISFAYFIILIIILKATFLQDFSTYFIKENPTYSKPISILKPSKENYHFFNIETSCPQISALYMSEIIDTTSESFDIEQDEINKMTEKISLICIKNTEKFNEISSTDYNIDQIDEYYAINRNHTIFIYIPDKQTHINKDYYGLLVHEITHSFQYQYYQQPITAILPEWFTEGQAEFERYSQIHQLEEQVFLASYNSTEYSKYLLEFNKIQTNLGKQDLYLLPLQLTDGKSLQEMIY